MIGRRVYVARNVCMCAYRVVRVKVLLWMFSYSSCGSLCTVSMYSSRFMSSWVYVCVRVQVLDSSCFKSFQMLECVCPMTFNDRCMERY